MAQRADKIFDYTFLMTGLLVQVITYMVAPTTPLSLISGLLGICSVVLCSQGNIWTFFFGFAQIITYTILCYKEHLYGAIGMNIYYFVTQIYGVYLWRKRIHSPSATQTDDALPTRTLPRRVLLLVIAAILLVSAVSGWLLAHYTDDTQPYLDAITTVPALVAQILMILAYRDQWYFWFMIDILFSILWFRAGNYCMLAQHIFWCGNCIYGYLRWTRLMEGETVKN